MTTKKVVRLEDTELLKLNRLFLTSSNLTGNSVGTLATHIFDELSALRQL